MIFKHRAFIITSLIIPRIFDYKNLFEEKQIEIVLLPIDVAEPFKELDSKIFSKVWNYKILIYLRFL